MEMEEAETSFFKLTLLSASIQTYGDCASDETKPETGCRFGSYSIRMRDTGKHLV